MAFKNRFLSKCGKMSNEKPLQRNIGGEYIKESLFRGELCQIHVLENFKE